jgi:hypothetical protein
MANTYTLIASQILSTATASITFASIPSTYTDLKVVASARDAAATSNNGYNRLTFNGTTTGYSERYVYGSGTAAGSSTGGSTYLSLSGNSIDSAGNTANTFTSFEFYIPNYASSNYKSLSSDGAGEDNSTLAYMLLYAGLWSNTAAITSLTITSNANYVANSAFYLYGISNS